MTSCDQVRAQDERVRLQIILIDTVLHIARRVTPGCQHARNRTSATPSHGCLSEPPVRVDEQRSRLRRGWLPWVQDGEPARGRHRSGPERSRWGCGRLHAGVRSSTTPLVLASTTFLLAVLTRRCSVPARRGAASMAPTWRAMRAVALEVRAHRFVGLAYFVQVSLERFDCDVVRCGGLLELFECFFCRFSALRGESSRRSTVRNTFSAAATLAAGGVAGDRLLVTARFCARRLRIARSAGRRLFRRRLPTGAFAG